jgi:cysteine desulfurase
MPRGTFPLKDRIYLDYAASTPVDPRVLKIMQPYFSRSFGNPGSLHSFGQEGIAAVDDAREVVADILGVNFRQILFTGSATEANNLALRGAMKAAGSRIKEPKILISSTEHESVEETARMLFEEGAEVVRIPVDKEGRVDVEALMRAVDRRTVLVSVMFANNETGTLNDIPAIGAALARVRAEYGGIYPLFHTDAVQAFQYLPCRPDDLGADLMTLSAHKVCGPKGVGVLYVRDLTQLTPVLQGGGQEFGLRSGTENVPLIVGAAEAFRLAGEVREKEVKRMRGLTELFWQGLGSLRKKMKLNGVDIDGEGRIPNVLNIRLASVSAEQLLTELDLRGVAASAGSACASRSHAPSRVLKAMGLAEEDIRSSIRVSLGRFTQPADIRRAVSVLKKIITN